MTTMTVQSTSEGFTSRVIKPFGAGEVVESFPWTGEEREHQRRDNRKGVFMGHVEQHSDSFSIKCGRGLGL